MGGGGDSTSTTYYDVLNPTGAIETQSALGMQAMLGGLLPQATALTAYTPQYIPQISGPEQNLLNSLQGQLGAMPGLPSFNMAAPGAPSFNMTAPGVPALGTGFQTATDLGQIGTNPLFTAFEQTQLPQILQANALSGMGQGAQAEAISNAALQQAQNIAGYNLQQASQQNQAQQLINQAAQMGYGDIFQNWQAQNQLAQQGYGDIFQNWQAQNQLAQQGWQDALNQWQQQFTGTQQALQDVGLPRTLQAQQGQANYAELQALRNMLGQTVAGPFAGLMQAQTVPTTQTSGGGK
jgi:hypothetical protein